MKCSEYSVLGSSATLNGIAGTVRVENSSNLLSLGSNSPALIAQSIGGGGGATGDAKLYTRLGKLGGKEDRWETRLMLLMKQIL